MKRTFSDFWECLMGIAFALLVVGAAGLMLGLAIATLRMAFSSAPDFNQPAQHSK